MIKRLILDVVGLTLIGAGLIIFPLPIPVGLILIVLGIIALIASEQHARDMVKKVRTKNHKLDRSIRWAEKNLPQDLGALLRLTDPDEKED